MNVEAALKFLGWCTLVNWLLLLVWWVFLAAGGDSIYRLHGKWFKISRETFDATHYAGMAFFKMRAGRADVDRLDTKMILRNLIGPFRCMRGSTQHCHVEC